MIITQMIWGYHYFRRFLKMGHTDLGGLICWWEDAWNIIGDLEIILVFHMALTGDPPVDAAMGNMMIMGLGGIIPVFFWDKPFFGPSKRRWGTILFTSQNRYNSLIAVSDACSFKSRIGWWDSKLLQTIWTVTRRGKTHNTFHREDWWFMIM